MTGDRQKHTAYVGLGSNLESPQQQVCAAIGEIGEQSGISLLAASPLYKSKPLQSSALQDQPQPDYINAVIQIETSLAPLQLLDCLQHIEQQHGRMRSGVRWEPRTLDLDILLYDNLQLQDQRLTLPHYAMAERNFVLYPLQDVADSTLQIPLLGSLASLLAACSNDGLTRLQPC